MRSFFCLWSANCKKKYDTQEIRNEFLINNVMKTDESRWVNLDYDSIMVVESCAAKSLALISRICFVLFLSLISFYLRIP